VATDISRAKAMDRGQTLRGSSSAPVGDDADRCELCGYRSSGTFRDRVTHLRGTHPGYAQALLFRLAAPMLFLVEVVVMGALRSPPWAYLVALFSSFGLLFVGKQRSRSERRRAGARATLPMGRLLREGGLGILILLPLVAILIVALSGR
jgi:hypothetical protein